MVSEIELLYILSNKSNYDKYISNIKSYTLTKDSNNIIKYITKYYDKYPTISIIDWNTLRTWLYTIEARGLAQSKKDLYDNIFNQLDEFSGTPLVTDIIEHFNELNATAEVLGVANRVVDGVKSVNLLDIEPILDKYKAISTSITTDDEDMFVTTDLSDILTTTVLNPGLDWRMDCLNIALGPLRKGNLVVVGARPETGKTSFACSETTFMANQLEPDQKVIWFNNEESGEDVLLRNIVAATNLTSADICKDQTAASAAYVKAVGASDRILVHDNHTISTRTVEKICREHNPGLIVFNILDKVKGFSKSGNEVERLRHLFQWARELAKQYGPVIAIAQADGSAEGQQWIYQHQLYGSKTGIQGEADAIITIGKLHGTTDDRFIHVPKNKLAGGAKTVPKEKHGYFEVKFDQERSRYK